MVRALVGEWHAEQSVARNLCMAVYVTHEEIDARDRNHLMAFLLNCF